MLKGDDAKKTQHPGLATDTTQEAGLGFTVKVARRRRHAHALLARHSCFSLAVWMDMRAATAAAR